jgi:hypothetical protein
MNLIRGEILQPNAALMHAVWQYAAQKHVFKDNITNKAPYTKPGTIFLKPPRTIAPTGDRNPMFGAPSAHLDFF